MATANGTPVGVELDKLRALGRSSREAALRAFRRRAADARAAANRQRHWENAAPGLTLAVDAQAQSLQVPGLRRRGP
jgi:hypothetical protein